MKFFKKILYALFIYFILLSFSNFAFSSDFDKDWEHFFASKEASDKAVQISNQGELFSYTSQDKVDQIIKLKEKALSEAKVVSDIFLEKTHREMLNYYRNYYQKSLELFIYGMKNNDINAIQEYHILHSRFISWFNANRSELRSP